MPLAEDLAAYVTALRGVDASKGPPGYRGVPLAARDRFLREALAQLAPCAVPPADALRSAVEGCCPTC
ncbi:hypothetical protein ABZ178_02030 [Streptomyces massasporeus]|uniref:hypothetical protein n=1 Tax=Streptomyces massasporeus TaxID=67324 RepID=UPI0033BA506B